jgi:protease-4
MDNPVEVRTHVSVLELWGNVSTTWVSRLEEELQNIDCLLVVAIINSPGGTVTTSMNVAHEFQLLQKRYGKNVCVYSNNGIYSGAYMVATSSPFIGMSPGATMGSIGVVTVHANALKYWEDVGIKFDIIRSGENKFSYADINKLTPEQRQIIQDMIDESYNDFIDLILDSRYFRIKNALQVTHAFVVDSLKVLCDGRVYSAKTAQAIGLIDASCYFDEFMQVTYMLYHIPFTVEYKKDDMYYNISGKKKSCNI